MTSFKEKLSEISSLRKNTNNFEGSSNKTEIIAQATTKPRQKWKRATVCVRTLFDSGVRTLLLESLVFYQHIKFSRVREREALSLSAFEFKALLIMLSLFFLSLSHKNIYFCDDISRDEVFFSHSLVNDSFSILRNLIHVESFVLTEILTFWWSLNGDGNCIMCYCRFLISPYVKLSRFIIIKSWVILETSLQRLKECIALTKASN